MEAYARGPAWASLEEDRKGTLAPGMLADIAVFDRNLIEAGRTYPTLDSQLPTPTSNLQPPTSNLQTSDLQPPTSDLRPPNSQAGRYNRYL